MTKYKYVRTCRIEGTDEEMTREAYTERLRSAVISYGDAIKTVEAVLAQEQEVDSAIEAGCVPVSHTLCSTSAYYYIEQSEDDFNERQYAAQMRDNQRSIGV